MVAVRWVDTIFKAIATTPASPARWWGCDGPGFQQQRLEWGMARSSLHLVQW